MKDSTIFFGWSLQFISLSNSIQFMTCLTSQPKKTKFDISDLETFVTTIQQNFSCDMIYLRMNRHEATYMVVVSLLKFSSR